MATVASRTFVSSPARDAHQTWCAIADLLCVDSNSAYDELMNVSGIAASVITDRGPEGAPIVVTCSGPRTRIYCLYDDDAVDGSDANEDALGFDPLKGDWAISLPCTKEDLDWVQSALADLSDRVTARELSDTVDKSEITPPTSQSLTLIPEKFLES